jgi:hypothetical protein
LTAKRERENLITEKRIIHSFPTHADPFRKKLFYNKRERERERERDIFNWKKEKKLWHSFYWSLARFQISGVLYSSAWSLLRLFSESCS